MTTNLLTILHISDFHFTKRKAKEQEIVVDALEVDLKRLCIGHRKPDLIIFSGDLVQAAGLDHHDDAYDALIDRVTKATGCSDERFFITPGNHDLAWKELESFADSHRAWRSLIGLPDETDKLNALYESGAFTQPVRAMFSSFNDLESYLGGNERQLTRNLQTPFAIVDHIAPIDVDVVSINTAVLSAGGHKSFDHDERKLAVPEYALIEVGQVLKPGSFRVFVTHHPLGWLTEESSRQLEAMILKQADFHLFGHMHDPQPRRTIGLTGEAVANQAGAIFTSRRHSYNGYSLITIDRDRGLSEVLIRSYYKDRGEFSEGTDIAEGGRWWSSQQAREHFRKIAAPVEQGKFREHLVGPALDALRTRELAVGGEGELHDKFVAPPMRRIYIKDDISDDAKVEVDTPVTFNDVVLGGSNVILYAKPEYGRTTLLRELRYQLLRQGNEINFPRLPALIEFSDIGSNADSVLRRSRGASEIAPEGNDFESLLKLGHACVLIDDVDFGDRRRMRALKDFVAAYPKTRYIFTSPEASTIKGGTRVDPEMAVRFDFSEIQQLRRNDMRQLLERDDRCADVEEWLDRLQTEFREINLPFTAANGVILIAILSDKYNFTPINRAVLMEQFVDSTLSKAAAEQSRRATFDYTNKTDLLSHVAAWMARSEQYIWPREDVRTEMKAYVEARGLNVEIDDLMGEFMSSRIFIVRSDGRLGFRYRGVLEYFIALRMAADEKFKDWVMDEDRYLRYVGEIQYYAGKLRNDRHLVDLIAERNERLFESAIARSGTLDLVVFEDASLPVDDSDVDALIDEFDSPPLSAEQKDAELGPEIPQDADDRQTVFRPKAVEAHEKLMLSAVLYSGIIKNMELIPDSEKRRHLAAVWHTWAIMLAAGFRIIPRLAKERRVRINGALYEVVAPHGMSDAMLLRQMMLRLPHAHVEAMSEALGTEKLERQLTEPTLDEDGRPKIYEFLRTALIADLRLPATPHAVEVLVSKLRHNPYLLSSLIVHLSELRRLGRVREEHFRALEGPMAEAIATVKGGSHQVRADEKRRQMARLGKDRLMLTMKRDHEL